MSSDALHRPHGARAVRVSAPAKVNLHLAIGPLLADGYHPVRTIIHALELHDALTITDGVPLSFTCATELGIPAEQNLALRAARALAGAVGRELAVAITLEKVIPSGAGLGGGSADAAAVLCGLAALWELDPRDPRVTAVARSLGADVPFFLTGGAALLGGRGDALERVLPPLDAPVVLVKPGQPVPTAAAYRAFDRLPAAQVPDEQALASALEARDPARAGSLLYNAMTPASVQIVPAIADALALVRTHPGALGAAVAGSGSAVFGIFDDPAAAERCAEAALAAGYWSQATRFSAGGCRVERL